MNLLTIARAHLKSVIETEFAPEGLRVVDSYLHQAEGLEGPIAGTYPLSDSPDAAHSVVLEGTIGVQVYDRWEESTDLTKRVDPAVVEAWADRFRNAVRVATFTASDTCWYYQVGRIDYPPDPTGHRTRFEASVTAYGENPTLVETAA